MKRLFLALCLLLSAQGCVRPSPPPTDADPYTFRPEPPPRYAFDGLRLATLNAEFLFDGAGEEGGATFPHKGDPILARAHRDRVGEVIRMLDADLIMLVEIEDEAVLNLLINESLGGLGYTAHFVQGKDTFTGQDMGLLSRLPVEAVGRTDERLPMGEDREQGVSKNLYARLHIGDLPVTLIGVHFYARPTDPERKAQREAQAEIIRRLAVAELAAGRAVAVMGDFNDYDDATPDAAGHQPITDVLQRIKAAGPGPEDDLHNVMADTPATERYTNHWDRNNNDKVDRDEFSAIDHILLSPALYSLVREVTFVQAHNPLTVTDHFPIVVTLGIK